VSEAREHLLLGVHRHKLRAPALHGVHDGHKLKLLTLLVHGKHAAHAERRHGGSTARQRGVSKRLCRCSDTYGVKKNDDALLLLNVPLLGAGPLQRLPRLHTARSVCDHYLSHRVVYANRALQFSVTAFLCLCHNLYQQHSAPQKTSPHTALEMSTRWHRAPRGANNGEHGREAGKAHEESDEATLHGFLKVNGRLFRGFSALELCQGFSGENFFYYCSQISDKCLHPVPCMYPWWVQWRSEATTAKRILRSK
jgi:hypothetical protein